MRRNVLVIGALVVVAAAAVAGILIFNPGAEGKPDEVTLRIHFIHGVDFSGFYAAQEQGFYEDNNLEVTIEPAATGATPLQLVDSGSADFGVIGGANELINAQNKGMPLIGLAALVQKNAVAFISKKESGITGPRDFVGHKVGTWPGRTVGLMLDAMLQEEGIEKSRLNIEPAQVDMTPFFSGNFDVWPGMAFYEPVIARQQGVDVNVISPADYGVHLYGHVLFTKRSTVENNSDLVQRFVSASQRGWRWALDNPEQAVEYAMDRNDQLKKERAAAMFEEFRKHVVSEDTEEHALGWIDDAKWESVVQTLKDLGTIDSNASFEEPFTNQYLTQ